MGKFLCAGALFGVLFSVFSVNVALAGAQSCQIREDGRCNNKDEYLSIPGMRGCYICERGECITGDLVAATSAALDKESYKNYMFRCQLGSNDKWIPEKIPACTQAEYRRLCPDGNSKEVIINLNTGKPLFNDNSSQAVVGAQPCMGCVCISGYTAVDGKCISDADIAAGNQCTSVGGTWTGSECTCDKKKNIAQSTNGKSCVCISSDYEPDGVNGCKKTAAAIAADQQRQQDADNRSRKEACVNSGGVWTGSACTCDASKNLRVQNNVCVCLDDENYKRSGDRCVLTDAAALRQKCESATGAYWDGVSCQCYEPNYSFNGTVCREDPTITECKSINGARWANGACVCNQSGYVPNYQTKQCEKSAATLQAEQAVAAQQKIDQASATLQSITDGLRVNKWRNEEGKFNTSRLLSDSIAGVVLGTAGGLITSSVVKKSQVSDGFEDMQCTVGGQVVAGWGDEFRVGIQ